jgi:hypothetical protein
LYVASLLSLSSLASRAAAQSLVLRFNAPADCPSQNSVRARVLALLTTAEPKLYTLRVIAKVSARHRADYQIALQIDTGAHRAERVLHASRCADLVEAAAWLIALTVDPTLSTGEPSETTAGEAAGTTGDNRARSTSIDASQGAPNDAHARAPASEPSEPSAAETPASTRSHKPETRGGERSPKTPLPAPASGTASGARRAAPPETAEPTSPPWPRAFRAGGTLGMITGDGAGMQAALAAFVGYGIGVFYSQARVQGSLPREIAVATAGTLRIWTLTSELSECALFGTSLRVGPCLGISLVRSAAELEGQAVAYGRPYLWAAADAGLQFFWLLPRHVELSLGAAARLPVTRRPRYVVEGLGTVGSAPTWSADVRVGVGFALR